MDDSTSRVKALVREAFADHRDVVHVRDLDTDKFTSIKLSERFGAITIRFGDSYTIHVDAEDARAVGEALLSIATKQQS